MDHHSGGLSIQVADPHLDPRSIQRWWTDGGAGDGGGGLYPEVALVHSGWTTTVQGEVVVISALYPETTTIPISALDHH